MEINLGKIVVDEEEKIGDIELDTIKIKGSTDYNELKNKPSINDITLEGNKTLQELGIQPIGEYALKNETYNKNEVDELIPIKTSELENDSDFTTNAQVEELITSMGGGETNIVIDQNKYTSNNPFILEGKKPGIYIFRNITFGSAIYLRGFATNYTNLYSTMENNILYISKEVTRDLPVNEIVGAFQSINGGYIQLRVNINDGAGLVTNGANSPSSNIGTMYKDINQTISGKKTFTTLPESSVVPTSNNQLVNKAYVDGLVGDVETLLGGI